MCATLNRLERKDTIMDGWLFPADGLPPPKPEDREDGSFVIQP